MVPNITLGAPVLKSLRKHTDAFFDCHLMVTDPAKWVDVSLQFALCLHQRCFRCPRQRCTCLDAHFLVLG